MTAKKFLGENNIHYVEKDVNTDQEAQREMMKRKATGVPSFLIGDDMVVGLDRAKILALADHRLVACTECGTKMRVPSNKGKLKVTCSNCGNRFIANPK